MIIFQKTLILIFILIVSPLSALEVYQIDTRYPVQDLSAYLQIKEDKDVSLSTEQIIKDTTLTFSVQDSTKRHLAVGVTYWAKMSVETQNNLKGWTLNFEDKLIGFPAWCRSNGKIDVYAFVDGKLIFHKKTGVEYPKHERDIQHNWILNRVTLDDLPVNTVVNLVLKAKGNSLGFPAYFNATIRNPKQAYYHEVFAFNESFNLFMFGVTFIIFIYHFLQYIYLRQRVFLWFCIWILFCMLTMAMSVGLIIGAINNFRYPIWMFIANGVLYSFWFFGRSFINSKEKFPTLDKIIVGLSIFMVAEIILTVLYVIVYKPQPYSTGVGIHYNMIVLYSSIGFILSIVVMFKKDQFARYFGFGAIIVSLALVLGGLWSEQLIRLPFDPYAWGMFLQIIIYSFGIAYRQRTLLLKSQEEKLEAQKNYTEMLRIKDLDEFKMKFFANISHEFRTPLSLISGPLNHARNSINLKDERIAIPVKTFDIIEKNTLRLQNLIDQLLELSKIESGKIYLNLRQGNLINFIKSLSFSFESMSESKGISFNSSFPEELNIAFYDKDKLEKIISNLLSNAFKYTPNGGTVTITVDYTDTHYTIEISDTGKGMAKEDVKRVFERFYRVEGSEANGSGIGLALTKEMVDLHNGQISVNSKINAGTNFKVRVPFTLSLLPEYIVLDSKDKEAKYLIPGASIVGSNELKIEAQKNSKPQKESNFKRGKNPLVLLVEDNADLRNHISDVLESHYRVIIAEEGLKGERLAIEHIPDIIISDVMMPRKDGYQLCHDLKSNSKTSHIPIIMLTAKAGYDNKMEGLTQGVDAYITKPFKAEELLLRTKNLINNRVKMWEHFNTLDLVVVKDLDVLSIDDQFLQHVIKVIRSNIDNEFLSVEDLAKEVGFSRAQLHRKLKALCNKSANQLIVEIRLNEAKRMLENKLGTVSEIAYSVGYSNMSYFTKSFKEKFGILPSKVQSA